MNYTHELSKLRETLSTMAAQMLAQQALLTALTAAISRQYDFREVLPTLGEHAADLLAFAEIDPDMRDRAQCVLEDLIGETQRNFVERAIQPWSGTA